LLPLLNSKLITFFIKGVYSALGIDGGINFSKDLVSDLPIPLFSKSIFDKLEKLSNKIIEENLTKTELKECAYTDEIDKLVYELYELTEEEIHIIENSI
ncbi:class I SAM-dependent DNA methyltransferase, partial [Candidatus Thioglobus sp.]|nr:class I SAM-dependent DNA methyltransferase [Candidatus Thioglobus sp.]